jgi:spore germination protein YaaH
MLRPLAAALLFVSLTGCASTSPPAPKAPILSYGYHPYWMGDEWREAPLDRMDGVFFFEIEVEGDGSLRTTHGWPTRWEALIDSARATGTVLAPTFTLFGSARFDSVFTSAEAVRRLQANVLGVATNPASSGVHLDFEMFTAVDPGAREAYTRFVEGLAVALETRRPDAHLSLFLPPFDTPDAFDETRLAAASDHVVVQGYDFHYRGSETSGPVAPIRGWGGRNWEAVARRYDLLGVPMNKILMAVPLYGYEWPTETDQPRSPTRGRGNTVSLGQVDPDRVPGLSGSAMARAAQHGLRRDVQSGSPWYAYERVDGWYQGWFEDEESLRAKLDFVRMRGMAGVAFFPLGYDEGRTVRRLLAE